MCACVQSTCSRTYFLSPLVFRFLSLPLYHILLHASIQFYSIDDVRSLLRNTQRAIYPAESYILKGCVQNPNNRQRDTIICIFNVHTPEIKRVANHFACVPISCLIAFAVVLEALLQIFFTFFGQKKM